MNHLANPLNGSLSVSVVINLAWRWLLAGKEKVQRAGCNLVSNSP